MRLFAYGALCVIALRAYEFSSLWREGVQRFIAINTLVTISPKAAWAQLCGPQERRLGPCRVQVSHRGADICGLAEAQLSRLRRFEVALSCRFIWIKGIGQGPRVSAETYRLTTERPPID